MGAVLRFWKNVDRTQTREMVDVTPPPRTIDMLSDDVRRAQSTVVIREAELARAQDALQQLQQEWAQRVYEQGLRLGIPTFEKLNGGEE